ncbi:MAG: hypothetical protein H6624_16950 [Bdellovibrionaceae bacterium]|nr:hypothetical protein [Pseudobdellovibrionaceae bacterium]
MVLKENIALLRILILSEIPPEVLPFGGDLPLWLRKVAKYHKIKSNKTAIGLIEPKTPLEFDVLRKIYSQVEKKEPIQWLISADKINPRYRALFVKNNIPFIFKDQSIFAPLLGLKINRKQLGETAYTNAEIVSKSISALELKLLAGVLSNQLILADFNLDDLLAILTKRNITISKMTLSRAINKLIKRELVITEGSGPNRQLNFKPHTDIWHSIRNTPIKTGTKLVEVKWPILKKRNILSGESALQFYSDLAEPEKKTFAVTQKDYEILKQDFEKGEPSIKTTFIEVRKISPKLFSVKGNLNPIELYFELNHHDDERVQLSLSQMLKSYNLEAKLDD